MVTLDVWQEGEVWLLHHSTWVNVLFLFAFFLFFLTWAAFYAHRDGKLRLYLLWLVGSLAMQMLGEAIFFHPAFNQLTHVVFALPVIVIAFFFMLFVIRDYGVPSIRSRPK